MRLLLISFTALVAISCGSKSTRMPGRTSASNTAIGSCADAESSGVISASPRLVYASRDLNGDSVPEKIVSDATLCRQSNCFWNVFAERNGCSRYLGTIEGNRLEVLIPAGKGGFRSLRSFWALPSGHRELVHHYQFRETGYQLTEVLICREEGDKGIQCASEELGNE